MQEQRPYKITPETGWAQMVTVLDQAMPIEKRSRRFLVYWWSAAAVSAVAIIALVALLNKPAINAFQAQSESSFEKTEKNTNHNSTTGGNIHEDLVEKDFPKGNTNVSDDPTVASNELSSQNSTYKSAYTNKSTPVAKYNPGNVTTQIDQINEALITAGNDQIVFTDQISSDKNINVTEPLQTSLTTLYQSQLLTMLPLTKNELQLNHAESVNMMIEPELKKSRRIIPHLAAGVLRTFSNGLGLNAGAGVNVRASGKLSLTADVNYQYYDPEVNVLNLNSEADFTPDALVKDDLGYHGIGNYIPFEAVNTSSRQKLNPYIKNIHQWQISGGMRYDVTPRFFAEAGATVGFGIVAKSAYPIVSLAADPLTGETFDLTDSFNSFDIIRQTMISLYGGMGYKISPRTEVFAQIVHGLDHYLINDSTLPSAEVSKPTDHIRGINVGMRHHLIAGP